MMLKVLSAKLKGLVRAGFIGARLTLLDRF